jgi:hypothetical protein
MELPQKLQLQQNVAVLPALAPQHCLEAEILIIAAENRYRTVSVPVALWRLFFARDNFFAATVICSRDTVATWLKKKYVSPAPTQASNFSDLCRA